MIVNLQKLIRIMQSIAFGFYMTCCYFNQFSEEMQVNIVREFTYWVTKTCPSTGCLNEHIKKWMNLDLKSIYGDACFCSFR